MLVIGCRGLNGKYGPSQGEGGGSEGPSTVTTSGPPPDPKTSAANGTGSGLTTSTGTSISSGSTRAETTGPSSSFGDSSGPAFRTSSSSGSDSDSGVDPRETILVVFAAEGWRGDSGGIISPLFEAQQHCANDPEFSDGNLPCDLGNELFGFLRPDGLAIEALLDGELADWAMLPVYGAYSNGDVSLASSLESLVLNGPDIGLTGGGVTAEVPGAGFWTGGTAPDAPDCEYWSTEAIGAQGTPGSFEATASSWLSLEAAACAETRPILCLCDATFGELNN